MNTIQSILFATDFSAQAEAAFPLAAALARDYGARLIVAHVIPFPTVAYTTGDMAMIPPCNSDEVLEMLHQFDPHDPAIHVDYRVSEGDAPSEILRLAKKNHCDLIVIGTHGRTGLSRLVAGSVAEEVMRHAPCPVLTVRCPIPTEAAASAPATAAHDPTEHLLLLP